MDNPLCGAANHLAATVQDSDASNAKLIKKRVLSSEADYAALVRDHGCFVDKTPPIAKQRF